MNDRHRTLSERVFAWLDENIGWIFLAVLVLAVLAAAFFVTLTILKHF